MEKSIYIKIIEFGLKHPDGFTGISDKDLDLKEWEKDIVKTYLSNARVNFYETQTLNRNSNVETPFLVINTHGGPKNDTYTYIVNFDTHFKYLDYQELKFARENAKTARSLSLVAIILAGLSILIAILIPVFIKQTIKIDNNQFNRIEEQLNQIEKNVIDNK